MEQIILRGYEFSYSSTSEKKLHSTIPISRIRFEIWELNQRRRGKKREYLKDPLEEMESESRFKQKNPLIPARKEPKRRRTSKKRRSISQEHSVFGRKLSFFRWMFRNTIRIPELGILQMLTVNLGNSSHGHRGRAYYRHHVHERGRRRREEKRRQNVHRCRDSDGKKLLKKFVEIWNGNGGKESKVL